MPIPTSIAAAIIEWDRRGRLVDDESYVQNNAPVIARVLWDAVAALKQANAEICALVPMPFEGLPDFSLACPNEADRACLTNALLAIRAAIEMAEGLHEGDWCEEADDIGGLGQIDNDISVFTEQVDIWLARAKARRAEKVYMTAADLGLPQSARKEAGL